MSEPGDSSSGAAPAISVRGLTIGWGEEPLVENISFEVARGEIFAILGTSGAGKSTLLRCLIGLSLPLQGEIRIAGLGPPDLTHGLPPYGVMFQGGALFGSMTLIENVKLPLEQWTQLTPRDA
jgi:phospholipid/cholesterol/gamma-HCH transport system ATP-binding protein